MIRQEILRILKGTTGDYISGEKMSQTLGVTRAAVWKTIDGLRRDGYVISSVTNRGYRLVHSPDVLTTDEITAYIHTKVIGRHLICLDSVDSTNTHAKRLAMEGAEDGTIIIANGQTAGRGRLGRKFQSPEGKGVYLSALLTPKAEPSAMLTVTAFAAVAVCDAIEAVCGIRPQIKWTNDIVLDGKKLCGILTEMSVESESGQLQHVIVGIGTNINQTPEDFDEAVRPMATSLLIHLGRAVSRTAFAAALIHCLDDMYEKLFTDPKVYLDRYRADCMTVGREVRVLRGSEARSAKAIGIDDNAALIVAYEDGTTEALNSGEVSVRGMYGYV